MNIDNRDGWYIIATYKASSSSSVVSILGSNFSLDLVSKMIIDGERVTPIAKYTFGDTNEHIVEYWFDKYITTAYQMFFDCSSMVSLDVSNFDTSNITDMGYMFYGCHELTSLDVSNFDTSNVINMASMFSGLYGLTSLDVPNFNTSKVTNMEAMFNTCSGLSTLDLSNFDTSNVTSMRYMFQYCDSLVSLDLSSFDTSQVTNMDVMFRFCGSLISLKMMGSVSKLSSASSMFSNIYTTGTFSYNNNYDYSKIIAELPSTWESVGV